MTRTAVLPHALRTPPALTRRRDRLTAALADLRQLGLHAQMLTGGTLGEEDVRLQVWVADHEPTVELLWCCPDDPPPAHLQAVRIAAEERTVWRHPHGRCVPADITRFLCDLLLRDEETLSERYCRLG